MGRASTPVGMGLRPRNSDEDQAQPLLVGRAILPAAGFQPASRLKGGCGQDWPPHKAYPGGSRPCSGPPDPLSYGNGDGGKRRVWWRPAARSKTHDPPRRSWRRHSACRAATLGSAGELRSPKSVAKAPRRLKPALQGTGFHHYSWAAGPCRQAWTPAPQQGSNVVFSVQY